MKTLFDKAGQAETKIKLITRFLKDIETANVPLRIKNKYEMQLHVEKKKLQETLKCIQKEYPPVG